MNKIGNAIEKYIISNKIEDWDKLSNLLIEKIYKISKQDKFSEKERKNRDKNITKLPEIDFKERAHDCYADIIETIQLVASDYNRIENKPSLQIFLDCKSYPNKKNVKKIKFLKNLMNATASEDEIKLLRKQFQISSFNTETKPEIVNPSF